MYRKLLTALIVTGWLNIAFMGYNAYLWSQPCNIATVKVEKIEQITVIEEDPSILIRHDSGTVSPPIEQSTTHLSDKEVSLIALVTNAEAEGESEYGKRLVIDTILNRVDNDRFPDTVHDVIYQKNQFSSMWGKDRRVDRVKSTKKLCDLVREEASNRTNAEVLYFTAGDYGKYGKHLFKVGNHYFSK